MPENLDQKKEEVKEKEKSKVESENKKMNRRIKYGLCCCGAAFGFILIIVTFSFFRNYFWAGADVIPVTYQSPTPLPTYNSTPESNISYSEPQNCEQVKTPGAESISISTNNPGLKRDDDIVYYSIYGYTYSELIDQINKCGVKDEEENFAGRTNWNINWNFNLYPGKESCGIGDVTVGLKTVIYYPKWQRPDNFTPGLDGQWQYYISSLEDHENTHKQQAVDAANNLYNQFLGYKGASTCDGANMGANDIGAQIVDQLRIDGQAFDDRTNHGANP